jgi:hypothetical protein
MTRQKRATARVRESRPGDGSEVSLSLEGAGGWVMRHDEG